jgi:PEGA domain
MMPAMVRGLVIACVLGLACSRGPAPTNPQPNATDREAGAAVEPVRGRAQGGEPREGQPAAPGLRAGKPTIAILGLEIFDNGSGMDLDTVKAARELTAGLRDRTRAGTGPYVSAPDSDRELNEQKVLSRCESEAAVCMAAIGTELGADLLLYGRLEKSTASGQPVYRVSLKLLNVSRKQLVSSTVETVPVAESTGLRLAIHVKRFYGKLTGLATGGTLVIRANIDRGTVVIDDEPKGNLASGSLTLDGLAEGRHTLAIEANGYQRYEEPITIRVGQTLLIDVTMTEVAPRSPR